jgi:hypothetical protein
MVQGAMQYRIARRCNAETTHHKQLTLQDNTATWIAMKAGVTINTVTHFG